MAYVQYFDESTLYKEDLTSIILNHAQFFGLPFHIVSIITVTLIVSRPQLCNRKMIPKSKSLRSRLNHPGWRKSPQANSRKSIFTCILGIKIHRLILEKYSIMFGTRRRIYITVLYSWLC
jgi:hypothetical protein